MCANHLLLLTLAFVALSSPCRAAYDYAHFDTAPHALVFNLKDGAVNLGRCDGVYLITNYIVNRHVVYVSEAQNRFLAMNSPGYWTISNLGYLPSIVESQSGTLMQQLEGGQFTGYHWAQQNAQDDPTLPVWDAYEVRAVDTVAIAFTRKNMHSYDPFGAEGVFALSMQQVWTAETPSILGGSMDWSCNDDSCSRSDVYINYGKSKFLVHIGDGWVIDHMENLHNTMQQSSNINQQLRQHDQDVTQGWVGYDVAVSGYYALDVEGNHPPSSRRSDTADEESCTLDNWSECWGNGCCKPDAWTGKPYACHTQNMWYAQCIPFGECPEGWDCTILGHAPDMPEGGEGSGTVTHAPGPEAQPLTELPPLPPLPPASDPESSAAPSTSSSTTSSPQAPTTTSSAPDAPTTSSTSAPPTTSSTSAPPTTSSTSAPPTTSSTSAAPPTTTPAPVPPPPAPVGKWGGTYVVSGEADGRPVYWNRQTNSVISFDAQTRRWHESAAPLHRSVAEDKLLAGWAWDTTPVSIVANYRLPELSTIEAPDLCEDVCALNGGVPVPATNAAGPAKCLFTEDAVRSWDDAERYCEMHGGQLASLTSAAETDLALSLFAERPWGFKIWIGLYEESPTIWQWTDGTALMYSNWNTGEPNNLDSNTGGHENCAELYGYGSVAGKWNDNACHEVQGFVCARRYNAPPSSCVA